MKIAILNSLNASVTSTVLVILLAVPAAYALSIRPVKRWTDVLFFFLSTKMMPAVAALLPIYLMTNHLGLNDNIWALIVVYTAANLPIAVWMLRSFLLEVPREIIEAAQVDGARLLTILRRVIGPIIAPGLAATALICFIFAWNEFLFALRLTGQNAKTAPVFLAGSIAPEGLFLAHLCAVAFASACPCCWPAGPLRTSLSAACRWARSSEGRRHTEPGEIAVEGVEDPTPGARDVVVAVDACGICGTDIHIVEGEFGPTGYPIVPGHEFAGGVIGRRP